MRAFSIDMCRLQGYLEMDKRKKIDIETYRQAADMLVIGSRAVRKAQEENRRSGVPNVYAHNGTLYYELPSGELTTDNPFKPFKDSLS